MRHTLYLVYLRQCLSLDLMLYLCDRFFIFSPIFIVINHITLFKQTYLYFAHLLEYFLLLLGDNVDEESQQFSNSKNSASVCCIAFSYFSANFSLALPMKVLLIKKSVYITFTNSYYIKISQHCLKKQKRQSGIFDFTLVLCYRNVHLDEICCFRKFVLVQIS